MYKLINICGQKIATCLTKHYAKKQPDKQGLTAGFNVGYTTNTIYFHKWSSFARVIEIYSSSVLRVMPSDILTRPFLRPTSIGPKIGLQTISILHPDLCCAKYHPKSVFCFRSLSFCLLFALLYELFSQKYKIFIKKKILQQEKDILWKNVFLL